MSAKEEESRLSNTEERAAAPQDLVSSQREKRASRIPTSTTRQRPRESHKTKQPSSPVTSKPPQAAPARSRARHPSGKDRRPVVNKVTSSKSKENIAPHSTGTTGNSVSTTRAKGNLKSGSMSYMELKRQHQELVSALESSEVQSAETAGQTNTAIRALMEEIAECRESNVELSREISAYKGVIKERNQLVDSLQKQLEDIKFENERMAALLEGSQLDAFSGERVERATEFYNSLPEKEFELEDREQALHGFISTLETTIAQLQEHKQGIAAC